MSAEVPAQKAGGTAAEMDVSDDETTSSSEQATNAAISTVSTIPDKYGFMHVDGDNVHYEEEKLPVKMLRQREHKWLEMLEHWDSFMTHNFKKVRSRCRKGIPTSLRARAWQHLCGGYYMLQRNAGAYDRLLELPIDAQVLDEIRRDLHRQFPMHEMFMRKGGHGQEELMKVLRAYAVYNPSDGYSQAQAPLAAVLLMHMPTEQAFWCLVSICKEYLPGYYGQGLERVQLDGDILHGLVKKVSPHVYRHLKKQKLDPALYMVEWFMCVYSRTLPWASVLRVWDMFFCEGVKVLFRVGLVLIRYALGRRGILKQCPTMYETVEFLRNLPPEIMRESVLVQEMTKLDLDEDAMTREHHKQLKKRQKAERRRQKAEEREGRERAAR
ncbi:TBC1 domain family member 10A [Amphibalanus amphitrite]|uniref:TBC1 domain family member 10A n=1 Tax=Amphibalanus amphitrite TaxID=1232801 RepID=A0A6A4VZX0_AMPAM|nr:TBC1 domain family member 10A-like [Amphibalanus amphitrite]XP_043241646.1 TBC1 domain family member 10A-like [Amphibalanus amphitrite]XP_043241655.1 TBC1 domain family member 10A-like [Amphibalanus amphitrite]XP_043241662.1 TBC1 domain family member 10A-like [Amphibalanus amphitrite]XP_043243269.1 TBC1 domain family member 10A-like [Amphibalanus amphitrite]XP_043243270.1 TBC1 domain family member 10A-like [Amphibalanus amphitrite]XP_043243272.1 TBC1 domain family member 10A-like [Amphibal